MADEVEKKPEFVLNKKRPEGPGAASGTGSNSAPKAGGAASGSAPEKKRVVVVKKRTAASEHKQASASAGQAASAAPTEQASAEPAQTHDSARPVAKHQTHETSAEQKPAAVSQDSSRPAPSRPRTSSSFELNSSRPNVKAGNLSDHPRSNGGYRGSQGGYQNREGGQSGYQNREGGYQNREGGQGGGYGNREGGYRSNGGYRPNGGAGGFTGAQAREGYQNREREGQSGGYQGRTGGYQGDRPQGSGYAGRTGGYQGGRPGGFNRGPGAGRPGGFGPRTGGGFGGGSSMPPIGENKAVKKQFKGKKPVYNRKDKEEQFDEEKLYGKKKDTTPASVVPKQIDIMETISVSDLAKKMNLKASEIIGKLMSMGMMVTINQSIGSDTATLLAQEYGAEIHLVSLYDETVIASDKGDEQGNKTRPPIVTVMGHVDHGKTKTLDAIRHTNVAAGEAGGITQKIGAYQVSTPKGNITFLDTPGHEAFTMMRARGAQITDIVVLVVEADDGVMPQTLEALHHAKDAKVPIIVAVNKIDKPEANPDRVMTQLSEQGLTPEEWGGDTQYVKISALKGIGIDDLLDAILLQAEVLELKAQYDCRAEGKIIESRVDQGRGVVSTVIVQRGTLKIGDPFVAGIYSGRVRAMFDDHGEKVAEAGPSMPVEVLGMDSMPNAGDPFQVTETEKDARAISTKRQELKRFEEAKAVKKVTLDNLY